MKKKKLAFYIGSLQKGGAERVMVNLAEYFFNQGYDVTLVTTYLASNEYEVENAAWEVEKIVSKEKAYVLGTKDSNVSLAQVLGDVNVRAIVKTRADGGIKRVFSAAEDSDLSRVKGFMARFNRLRKIWKDLEPDLILSFLGKTNIMALLTSRKLGIPVVVSVRAKPSEEYNGKLMWNSMRLSFLFAKGVVLQTNGAKKCFPKSIQKKSVILPNSINPAFIGNAFFGERQKSIVTVGRLDYNKNQRMLIEAFSKLSDKYSDVKIHIYGDGPDRKELERLSADLKLNISSQKADKTLDRVIFEGQVSDVYARIQKAGIYVLTSDTEGMPNSLIEAMSLGIPCISTDCQFGPSELIEDGKNGLLVKVRDTDSLTRALDRLLSDSEYSKKLGKAAADISKLYAPEVINSKWKDYFDFLIERK
ncbi:glycosyltransferase [Butyrivibrio sp. NC3005]|uniref:glycosyltransferase n=1 Tax=Butyrivibrio sp. NC3005 TaxID=1280685 RepID=UPI0004250615|nr:glycosyltransferase [Butyrivibrio sp. NC3005]